MQNTDAYWNAKDEFEHDVRELFGGYISPEEFMAKWRPHLSEETQKSLSFKRTVQP